MRRRRVINQIQVAAAAFLVASLSSAAATHAQALFAVGGYAASNPETAVVVKSHLPDWLQVSVASATLYGSDGGSDVAGRLARNTFLRVLNGGAWRLQVQAYDENGNPGASGWVEAYQVLPSAPGIDWLVSSTATSLWSTADDSATVVRALDPFTPLQKLDDSGLGRVEVRAYRSDFSAVVGQGWVDSAATGPALPPQVQVPAPTDRTVGPRGANSTSQQPTFLDAAAQAAREGAAVTGVPASVTVAQAILESSWGQSSLATTANNYFGMKSMGSLGDDGVVWMPTSEYDDSGKLYQTMSAFKAYKSFTDSTADHDRLLQTAPRYATAMRSANDPRQFAALIGQAGYSTDPDYAQKLVALMDRYNLYQLDS